MTYDSRQVERERREYEEAEARVRAREAKRLDRGVLPPGLEAAVVRRLWSSYVAALEVWLVQMDSGAGRHSEAAPWIKVAGVERAAGACLSAVARGLLGKGGLTAVASAIGERLRDEILWLRCREADQTGATKTARNPGRAGGLEKRAPILAKSLGVSVNMPRRTRIKAGIVLLELLRQSTGAIQFQKSRHPTRKHGWKTLTVVVPTPEFEGVLARMIAEPRVRAAHGPMIAEPLPWDGNRGGGRHLIQHSLVKGRGDDALSPRMLSVANHLQSVAWRINPDVYWTLRRVWEETGRPVGHVPLRDPLPLPQWDPDASVERRTEAAALRHQNRSAASRRLAVLYALRTCKQLVEDGGTDLWYPVRYDYRGRVYYDVSYLSPQGNDLERGLLRFAGEPRELVDQPSLRAMAIHVANMAGHDKLPYDERVAWTLSRMDELGAISADPVGSLDLWEGAEEPWQYLAGACALVRGDDGALPVYSDGTCNGLQVFALLLRDEETAARVNVTPGDRPRDVYREVALRAQKLLYNFEGGGRMSDWLEGVLPRKLVKRTVMTIPYGVTKTTARMYLHEQLEEKIREGRTWAGSSEEFKASTLALADAVWTAVWELLPAAMRCREWLVQVARAVGAPFYWKTPLGYKVWSDPEKLRGCQLVTSVHGRRIAASIREGTGKIDKRKQGTSMPPNFVHSLDATCLHIAAERTIEAGHAWAGIHDCVGTRAGSYDFVARKIREAYAETFSEDLLEDLARQIRTRYGVLVPDPPERGNLDPTIILDSPYAFN